MYDDIALRNTIILHICWLTFATCIFPDASPPGVSEVTDEALLPSFVKSSTRKRSRTPRHGASSALQRDASFRLLRREQRRQTFSFFPETEMRHHGKPIKRDGDAAKASRRGVTFGATKKNFMREEKHTAGSHSRWTPITYDWKAAQARVFHKLPENARHPSTKVEYMWHNGAVHKCGNPCVAHCVVGLAKKEAIDRPERRNKEWGKIQHSFSKFSQDPVVFMVLGIAEITKGYGKQDATDVRELNGSIDILNPARAFFEGSKCDTGKCLKDTSKIGNCPKRGHYQCDLQIGRVGQCMELVKGYEKDHNIRFDFVTRIRADPKDDFIRNVTAFPKDRVSMARWEARRCYGGFDWIYVMPRAFAEAIGRFADEATCDLLPNLNSSAYKYPYVETISGFSEDPFYRAPLVACDGCEYWLAAWMWSKQIPFGPQPTHERMEERCRQCSYPNMCSVKDGLSTKCTEVKAETPSGQDPGRWKTGSAVCSEVSNTNLWCPKHPHLAAS